MNFLKTYLVTARIGVISRFSHNFFTTKKLPSQQRNNLGVGRMDRWSGGDYTTDNPPPGKHVDSAVQGRRGEWDAASCHSIAVAPFRSRSQTKILRRLYNTGREGPGPSAYKAHGGRSGPSASKAHEAPLQDDDEKNPPENLNKKIVFFSSRRSLLSLFIFKLA